MVEARHVLTIKRADVVALVAMWQWQLFACVGRNAQGRGLEKKAAALVCPPGRKWCVDSEDDGCVTYVSRGLSLIGGVLVEDRNGAW